MTLNSTGVQWVCTVGVLSGCVRCVCAVGVSSGCVQRVYTGVCTDGLCKLVNMDPKCLHVHNQQSTHLAGPCRPHHHPHHHPPRRHQNHPHCGNHSNDNPDPQLLVPGCAGLAETASSATKYGSGE